MAQFFFAGAALCTPTCPAFTQYVTRQVFCDLIHDLTKLPDNNGRKTPDPIRDEESHALRYVVGYICRKVQHKIETSSRPDKKDIVLFF